MATSHTTPRKRKEATNSRLPGLRMVNASVDRVGDIVASRLNLSFKPEQWQATLIHKIAQGYDCIFCAGTGYGKSLIFEGLAAFEKTKTFIVISPLKVLEMDQVREATAKGLAAIAINEDTIKADTDIWKKVRKQHFNLIYVSPELAVGVSSPMRMLWKDAGFCQRLGGIFVDEAHCIDEWGDKFREEYRALKQLRTYSGFEVPIVACSATMPTSTFDLIWDSLQFGHRPFWGLDVGTDRDTLFYTIRSIPKPNEPLLHVLNILPTSLSADTLADAIPKTLIYFPTPDLCAQFVRDLRKCLPAHLRQVTRHFSAGVSEMAKEQMWDLFMAGDIRILVSTEATALGCNDKHIEYCFVFLASTDPRTLSVLLQRWGRAARARGFLGFCFFFVPPWALRPPALPGPDLARVKGKTKLPETKAATARRAKLHEPLEKLINLKHDVDGACVHKYLASHFRPTTQLDLYTSLAQSVDTPPVSRGQRSLAQPSLSLTWTVLDLGRHPNPDRCCYLCNPKYSASLVPSARPNDPRLSAFTLDFLFPLAQGVDRGANRSDSPRSGSAASSQRTTSSRQPRGTVTVSKVAKTALHKSLDAWREGYYVTEGSSSMMTPDMLCPDRVINELVDSAGVFGGAQVIDASLVRSRIRWGLADDENLTKIAGLIQEWRETANISRVIPQSGRGNRKKARTVVDGYDASASEDDIFNPAGLLWAPNSNAPFILPPPPLPLSGNVSQAPRASPATQYQYSPVYGTNPLPQARASGPGFPVQGPGPWTPQTPQHPFPNQLYPQFPSHVRPYHPDSSPHHTPPPRVMPQVQMPSPSFHSFALPTPSSSQVRNPTYNPPPGYLAYYSPPYYPSHGSPPPHGHPVPHSPMTWHPAPYGYSPPPRSSAGSPPSSQHPLSQSHVPK